MFKKIIYVLLVLLVGSTIYLLIQNRLLTKKIYEIVAISNYNSLTYLYALDNNKSDKVKESLISNVEQFIKDYDKKIYLNNQLLKNICKDINLIEYILNKDDNDIKIKKIKNDCIKNI
jgi:hypothetical protein